MIMQNIFKLGYISLASNPKPASFEKINVDSQKEHFKCINSMNSVKTHTISAFKQGTSSIRESQLSQNSLKETCTQKKRNIFKENVLPTITHSTNEMDVQSEISTQKEIGTLEKIMTSTERVTPEEISIRNEMNILGKKTPMAQLDILGKLNTSTNRVIQQEISTCNEIGIPDDRTTLAKLSPTAERVGLMEISTPKEMNIPICITAPSEMDSEKGYNCAICLDTNKCWLIKQLPCSHEFHKTCIDDWLNRKKECPLCQAAILSLKKNMPPRNLVSHRHGIITHSIVNGNVIIENCIINGDMIIENSVVCGYGRKIKMDGIVYGSFTNKVCVGYGNIKIIFTNKSGKYKNSLVFYDKCSSNCANTGSRSDITRNSIVKGNASSIIENCIINGNSTIRNSIINGNRNNIIANSIINGNVIVKNSIIYGNVIIKNSTFFKNVIIKNCVGNGNGGNIVVNTIANGKGKHTITTPILKGNKITRNDKNKGIIERKWWDRTLSFAMRK